MDWQWSDPRTQAPAQEAPPEPAGTTDEGARFDRLQSEIAARRAQEQAAKADMVRRAKAEVARRFPKVAEARAAAVAEQQRARRATPEQAKAAAAERYGEPRRLTAEEALAAKRALLSATAKVRDPMYERRGEYIAAMRGAYGRERAAADELAEAQRLQAQRLAAEQEMAVREEGTRLAEQHAVQRLRSAEMYDQIEAQKQVQKNLSLAANRLAEVQDLDPGKIWSQMDDSRKVAFTINAMLRGVTLRDPMANINAAIDREIDAAKFNVGLREKGLAARQAELAAGHTVYGELLDALGDGRMADLAYNNALLDATKRQIAALTAQSGLKVMNAEQQATLAQIDQQMAQNKLALDQMAVANRPYRYVRAVGGPAREGIEQDIEDLRKMREMGTKASFDIATEQAKSQTQAQAAGDDPKEVQRSLEWAASRLTSEQLGKDFKLVIQGNRLLNEFKEGIPGFGGGALLGTVAKQKMTAFIDQFARTQSGQAIPPKEFEKLESVVKGRLTESQTIEMIKYITSLAEAQVGVIRDSMHPKARDILFESSSTRELRGGASANPSAGNFEAR